MDALFNIFSVQLRIGIFDKPNHNQLGPNNVGTEEHRELPVEAVTSTKKKGRSCNCKAGCCPFEERQ